MRSSERKFRYTFAILISAVSYLAKSYIFRKFHVESPFMIMAVSLASWWGGIGPGLIAVLGTGAAELYFFTPPGESFAINNLKDAFQLVSYVFVAVVIGSLVSGLLVSQKRALAAGEAKSRFLANMSHELRTPLSAVYGMTELLLREPISRGQREKLQTIKAASESLLAMINEVLDYSKAQFGKLKLMEQDFELSELVEQVSQLTATSAKSKGLSFEVQVKVDGPSRLRADLLRLKQLVVIFLDNAVKFTEKGGIKLSVECRASELLVEISDTGRGIDPAAKDRIYEAFFQEDNSHSRMSGGAGLGLSIAKYLIRIMSGDIRCESEIGKGTSFFLRLPVAYSRSPERLQEPARGNPKSFARRILVAEDNLVSQKVISKILESLGAEVILASDGEEVLKHLENYRFDLVLMDLQMPNLDGYQSALRLRKMELERAWARTPVLGMTASTASETYEDCLRSGMDDCLTKPMGIDDLSQIIRKWAPKDYLGDLTKTLGEPGVRLVRELKATFLKLTPARLATIHQALRAANWPSLSREAHALKSSCAALGLEQMTGICTRLEAVAMGRDHPEEAVSLIQDLDRNFNACSARFRAEVAVGAVGSSAESSEPVVPIQSPDL